MTYDKVGKVARSRQDEIGSGVEQTLARIFDREPEIRAFVDHRPDWVRDEMRSVESSAPLRGLCVGVKEIIDVAGYRCAWGTPIHGNRVPDSDARMVQKLRNTGGIVAGITVSTEYALARPGSTTNPHDSLRTPGGSSSGSAAAVGAGMIPAAFGTQTIGSIIRPAAYCGVVGYKPTWGIVDNSGVMPLCEALDHLGIIADSVSRVRLLLSALTDRQQSARPDLSGVRAALLAPWFSDPVSAAMTAALRKAAEIMRETGIAVEDAALPGDIGITEEAVSSTLLCHDLVRHHGHDFRHDGDKMSDPLVEMMKEGSRIAIDDYQAARRQQDEIAQRLDAAIGPDGVFLAPATLGTAPLRQQGTGSRAPQRLWSLGGQPAVTVTCGWEQGLPLGAQVIAARGCDDLALHVAELLEAKL